MLTEHLAMFWFPMIINEYTAEFQSTKTSKQLLDEVFVICRIINVEVRVISYRDIDNLAYHKNRIQ